MLSDETIIDASARLVGGKLTLKDVNKLFSIFRRYLKSKMVNYPNLKADIAALDDSSTMTDNAAQYAACLLIEIDSDFGVEAFQATNQSQNNFNYSEKEYRFEVFLYMLGLLYDVPDGLTLDDTALKTVPVSHGGSYYKVR